MKAIVLGLSLVCSAIIPAGARSGGHPQTIELAGSEAPLTLAGQATRTHLLGTVELYSVAVYVNGHLDADRLASAGLAKALRIEVRYQEDLRRRVPVDWRRELIPLFEHAATAHLRNTFAPLQAGDVVFVGYVPGKGTRLHVNKAAVASGAGHDLMLAFLDHWLGQRPVSETLKRAILDGASSR